VTSFILRRILFGVCYSRPSSESIVLISVDKTGRATRRASVRRSHVSRTSVDAPSRAGHTSATIDSDVQPAVAGARSGWSEGRDGVGSRGLSNRAKQGSRPIVMLNAAAASVRQSAESAHATFLSPHLIILASLVDRPFAVYRGQQCPAVAAVG